MKEHYYYNQLNEEEKIFFKNLYSAILRHKPTVNFSVKDKWAFDRVLFAIRYDCPELFQLRRDHLQFYAPYTRGSLLLDYHCSHETWISMRENLDQKIQPLLQSLQGKTQEQGVAEIHDWLVRNCSYGTTEGRDSWAHSILGAIEKGVCVCEGYSMIFKYICDKVKIPCLVATGDLMDSDGTGGGHAWNMVALGNKNYHIDVTLDHYIENTYCSRAYYLLSTEEIHRNHREDPFFPLPLCPVSGSPLPHIGGTALLISHLKNEFLNGSAVSEMWLNGNLSREKVQNIIDTRLCTIGNLWCAKMRCFTYDEETGILTIVWR